MLDTVGKGNIKVGDIITYRHNRIHRNLEIGKVLGFRDGQIIINPFTIDMYDRFNVTWLSNGKMVIYIEEDNFYYKLQNHECTFYTDDEDFHLSDYSRPCSEKHY